MTRYEELRIKDRERQIKRKAEQTNEMLQRVDEIRDNTDSIAIPSMSIMKEESFNYINFHIARFPMLKQYSVTFYRKMYPFEIYYSRDYYESEIPKKHKETFKSLDELFDWKIKLNEKNRK